MLKNLFQLKEKMIYQQTQRGDFGEKKSLMPTFYFYLIILFNAYFLIKLKQTRNLEGTDNSSGRQYPKHHA